MINLNNFGRVPGINCPCCGYFIPTSINKLLTKHRVHCPTCHLWIMLDWKHSMDVLQDFSRIQDT